MGSSPTFGTRNLRQLRLPFVFCAIGFGTSAPACRRAAVSGREDRICTEAGVDRLCFLEAGRASLCIPSMLACPELEVMTRPRCRAGELVREADSDFAFLGYLSICDVRFGLSRSARLSRRAQRQRLAFGNRMRSNAIASMRWMQTIGAFDNRSPNSPAPRR